MNSKSIILLLILSSFSSTIFAQKLNYEISDNPNKMFDLGNFHRAKEIYRKKKS